MKTAIDHYVEAFDIVAKELARKLQPKPKERQTHEYSVNGLKIIATDLKSAIKKAKRIKRNGRR